jgi:DNA polymerase III subunit epsilon
MTEDISTLEFVAFDTETTGLSPSSEALVEVAAVRFNLIDGPLEYFQTLIDPERSIPYFATRVHGIDDAMVAGKPKVEAALPQFFSFIGNSIPVAHHAPFDIGFLSLYAMRTEVLLPETPVLDTCVFSRRTAPEQPTHKLEALVKAFGVGESTFHRALADAKSCMEVFRILVAKSCGDKASWEQLIKAHGRVHSFTKDAAKPIPLDIRNSAWEPLLDAMESKQSLWIEYEGNFGPREITPLLVYAKGAKQYLEATCHLDGIRKNFRLDKIKKVFRPGLVPELG